MKTHLQILQTTNKVGLVFKTFQPVSDRLKYFNIKIVIPVLFLLLFWEGNTEAANGNLSFLGTQGIPAKGIYVSQAGSDSNDGLSSATAVSSISVALNLAADGDTVHISGFIDISIDPANTANPRTGINLAKNLIFVGLSDQTDGIDGHNASRLLTIGSNIRCTIKNLTLKNGSHPDEGGAIYLNGGFLNTENVIFTDNSTTTAGTSNGGAIKINAHKGISFVHTCFINNSSGKGGAVYMQDSNTPDVSIRIESCSFISNSTRDASGGSAMFVRLGNAATNNVIDIVNTTIAKNQVTQAMDGGAIFLYRSAQVAGDITSVNFVNCTITENTTAGSSGHCAGIKVFNVSGQFTAKLNILNSIIEGNYSNQSLAYSDVVYASPVTATSLVIKNSIIGRDGVSETANAIPAECYTGDNMFNYLTSTSTSIDLIAKLGVFDENKNAYLLQQTSPAVNFGNAQFLQAYSINTDQLGNIRSFSNNKCYTGSVEEIGIPAIPNKKGPNYKHLIIYGQSLSTGHQAYPVISAENVAGNYMIGEQIWINYGNNKFTEFTPLRGTVSIAFQSQQNIMSRSSGTIAECPLLGAANHIRLKNPQDTILATSCGTSGMTIEQLSKESQTKNLYNDFLNTLKYASQIAQATNSTISCPVIFWMQGEWNYQGYQEGLTPGSTPTGDKNEYKALLLNLKNNMQADIQSKYGQAEKPLFVTYETGVQYIKGKEQAIGMAQLEASNENSDIAMAGPVYQMTDRVGHLDPNGYRWYGEMLGKIYYYTRILNQDFKPLQPKRISRTAETNKIEVKFLVPNPPIVLDQLIVDKVRDYGFEVYLDNTRQTITNVMVSEDCVYLTCSSALNGTLEVIYAGQNTSGHGNLRDSDPYQAFFKYIDLDKKNMDGTFVYPRDANETTLRPSYEPKDASGNVIYDQFYPLYNFCVSFYYKLDADKNSYSVPQLDTPTDVFSVKNTEKLAISQHGKKLVIISRFDDRRNLSIQLYNLSGKIVASYSDISFPGLARKEYTLSSLSKGIYIAKVVIRDEVRTVRLYVD